MADGRGFAGVSGEFRCALYNHYYLPNSATPDCIASQLGGGVQTQFTAWGWRAARSRHPGGISMLVADGSVQFVHEEVDLPQDAGGFHRGVRDLSLGQPVGEGE